LKRLQSVKRKRAKDESAFTPDAAVEESEEADEATSAPKKKRASLASNATDGSPLRRSSRAVKEMQRLADEVASTKEEDEDEDVKPRQKGRPYSEHNDPQRLAKKLGVRTENP